VYLLHTSPPQAAQKLPNALQKQYTTYLKIMYNYSLKFIKKDFP